MFINLFRRQRPALARLARNSNAYRQPMVAAVSSSAVGVSSITSAANTANTDGVSGVSTLDATIGRIHDIPQSAMSRLTGSPTVYARRPAQPTTAAQRLGSMIQLKVSNTAKNRTLTAE